MKKTGYQLEIYIDEHYWEVHNDWHCWLPVPAINRGKDIRSLHLMDRGWWTLTSLLLDCQNAKSNFPLVRLNLGNSEIILTRKGKIFEYLVKKIASTFYWRNTAAIHKNSANPLSSVWLLIDTGWAGNISFPKHLFCLSIWLGKSIPFSLMRILMK